MWNPMADKNVFILFSEARLRRAVQAVRVVKFIEKRLIWRLIFIHLAGQECAPYTKAPASSTTKCTPTVCTATCAAKMKFPQGETTLSIDCVNKVWTMKSPKYKGAKEIPGCIRKWSFWFQQNFERWINWSFSATCNPACANKGKCVAPNRCQCTADFQGPTCREKACKQQPAMTKNAKRVCKPSWVL